MKDNLLLLLEHGKHLEIREILSNPKLWDEETVPILLLSYIETGDYARARKIMKNWEERISQKHKGLWAFFQVKVTREKVKKEYLLNIANEILDPNELGYLFLALSYYLFYNAKFAEAGMYAQKSISNFVDKNSRGVGLASQLLGTNLYAFGDYLGAENAFLQALDARRAINNPEMIAQTASSLGAAVLKQNRYLTAKNWYLTALEEGYRLSGSTSGLCSENFNSGVLAFKIGHLKESNSSFQLAVVLAKQYNYQRFLADSLYFLGKIEYISRNYKESKDYFKQALIEYYKLDVSGFDRNLEILNTLFSLCQALIKIGEGKLLYDQVMKYEEYFDKSSEGKVFKLLFDDIFRELQSGVKAEKSFYKNVLTVGEILSETTIWNVVSFCRDRLMEIMFKDWLIDSSETHMISLDQELDNLYKKSKELNLIPLQLQILLSKGLMNFILKKEKEPVCIQKALELADKSELPWHYGFIAREVTLMRSKSPEDPHFVEILENCLFDFQYYLNKFISEL